jgi:hypothetical protein
VLSGWLVASFESKCGCPKALMATDLHGVGAHATTEHRLTADLMW